MEKYKYDDDYDLVMKQKPIFHCLKCDWRWLGKVPNPRSCPHCKRYDNVVQIGVQSG